MRNCKHCNIDLTTVKGAGLQCYPCKNGLDRYGLNRLDMIAMHEAQEGLCGLCDKPVNLFTRRTATAGYVDHSHKTGTIRGLLCHPCNTILGYIETNLDLNRVQNYILEGAGEVSNRV